MANKQPLTHQERRSEGASPWTEFEVEVEDISNQCVMQAVRGGISRSLSSKTSAAARHSSHSKKVFTDISNGRSFVAYDSCESRPSGGRMPRDERRALVKDFVDKYRALNAGKFPTPSAAKREVGGSYYVVKSIVQELEYNTKRSPVTTTEKGDISMEELPKEESLADLTCSTKSLGRKNESQKVVVNNMDVDKISSTSNKFEAKKETPDSFEMLLSEDVLSAKTKGVPSNSDEKHIHQTYLKGNKAAHLGVEDQANCEKNASTSDGSLELNEPKPVQVVVQETIELDKLENKGVSVSHLCIEDLDDSKKEAATSDSSLGLKEPQVVQKAAQETFESYNLGNKEVSDLYTEDLENSNEKSATSEGSLDFNEPMVGLGAQQEAYKSEKLERDVSKKENEEQRSPNKSTVWGNLRSFAEGVINLWKKL